VTAPLLEGRVALVSGVGGGLGRAVCLALAAHGARIVAGDVADESVEATVAAVREMGGEATGVPADIRSADACIALADHAASTFGGIDVLVNNAYDGGDFQLFESADLSRWKATAEVNIWGSLQMTQAALEQLKQSASGRVVMICTHGVDLIQPTFGAYTSSKAALAHLTKLLASELGRYRIRVNGVFPGPIFGPALKGYFESMAQAESRSVEEVQNAFAAKNVLGCLVPPDEIAGSVVFLASDLSLPITGQALYVNAGEIFH
jgi:NAD(P)-dependent dehydrogenase (short-subunit alcohol dehydrogenase family)